MKKLIYFSCVLTIFAMSSFACKAQIGYISTFAQNNACNIAVDNNGLVYVANGAHVYRVDSGGNQTTIVGGGVAYGDGGPATAAMLNDAVKVVFDAGGNMYIADLGDGVIRKVSPSGIISTVAGNHTLGPGYTGDGGPATSAKLRCNYICLDAASNIYISDETDFVIRKVNASGIISTVAGNGTNGYSGDGGPATSASLGVGAWGSNRFGIATDISGNLYITDAGNRRVRKVNTAGIISTFAGDGTSGPGGEGGPATAAQVYFPQGLTTDLTGNLYIAEWQNCVLAAVNPAGIYFTVAGNYTINFSGDGGLATAAALNAVSDVAIAPNGDIYISDCHNSRIRKVTGAPSFSADSFSVYVNHGCNGPAVSVYTHSYAASMHIKAFFGDDIVPVDSAILSGNNGGYAIMNHLYATTGTYSVKLVLYNGNTKLDSLHFTYDNIFCSTTSIQFYNDANGNCIKDATESSSQQPVLVQVDSNNVHVDTISATSGFYYTAYGNAGDVYKFKVISAPAGMQTSCPANGTITTTLQASNITTTQYMGFSCINGNNFDLAADAVIPVTGIHDQWGNIYVRNNYCTPTNATVTLNFSPKYVYNTGWAHPTPSSVTGSSITWNLTGLSSSDPNPVDLYYAIWDNPAIGYLTVGDTVQEHITVTPTTGDMDPVNNIIIHEDTVKGSCDPNLMEVTPEGFISPGAQLKYRIEFENVGNDTAFNIYVLDTLPNELDANSLRLVSSTHTMYISPFGDGTHNIVKFDFPNINLLDSSHHEACTGTFSYTIKTKTGLPFGTHIDHAAGIYFDDNGLVETNMVENIIGWSTSVTESGKEDKTDLYPNPATNELTIKADNELYQWATISNSMGQVVMQKELTSRETKVNVKGLSAGLYYVSLKGEKGSVVRKFVKM